MEKIIDRKRCPKCGEIKNINEFENKKGYSCNMCKLKMEEKRKEKSRQSSKEHYEKNREKILEKSRERMSSPVEKQKRKEYLEKNKERLAAQRKKYREENREWLLENARKRREKNKDEINKRERERRNTPEGKLKQKERDRVQREKHRDKINERTRRWHEKNKEHVRNRKIQKRLENPEYAKELRLNSYARTRGFKNYAELLIDRENRKLKTKDSIKNFEKRQFSDIIEFKDEWKELCKTFKKEERKKYDREKYKEKRINDIQYKLSDNMRARVRKALKNQSAKKTKSTMDLVGCTGLELSYYLENLGYDKSTDHIDHIVPISKFNLIDPEHQLIACHYLNLQPLHYSENCSKHDSLPENWQDVIIRICEVRNINSQPIIEHIRETAIC